MYSNLTTWWCRALCVTTTSQATPSCTKNKHNTHVYLATGNIVFTYPTPWIQCLTQAHQPAPPLWGVIIHKLHAAQRIIHHIQLHGHSTHTCMSRPIPSLKRYQCTATMVTYLVTDTDSRRQGLSLNVLLKLANDAANDPSAQQQRKRVSKPR